MRIFKKTLDRNFLIKYPEIGMVFPEFRKALCDHCGMTQRQVAEILRFRTGVAVSCQLRKLSEQLKKDKKLKHIIEQIRKKMMT